MNRRVLINLLAFLAVFAVTLWWAVTNIISFDFIDRPYQINGEFAATAGVAPDSEVTYLGVHYGAVKSVSTEGRRVLIEMDIDRGKRIPEGSTAHISRKSAVGEPYIDFRPPEDFTEGGPTIEPGTTIPLEDTTVPLEFSELLKSASRVLAAVDPEQTQTLVHELAVALAGRGETLRSLTIDSDQLLATFAERTELLDRLSANSTQLTRTVTERRDSLSSAISDLADLAESLQAAEPDTRVLLDRGTELLGRAANLVADVKQNADCLLKDLDDVIDVTSTDANLAITEDILQNLGRQMNFIWMSRDNEPGGLWVRVALLVNPENPPTAYIPHTQLPAVPEVPACVSSLSTGGARFASGTALSLAPPAPSTTAKGPSGILADTGSDAAAALVLFIGAGLAFSLVARRNARRLTEQSLDTQ